MNRLQRLHDLVRRLDAAGVDWGALEDLERELIAILTAQYGWSTAERGALDELARAHARARSRCEQETERLGEVLAGMRDKREGWLAYGKSDEFGDSKA